MEHLGITISSEHSLLSVLLGSILQEDVVKYLPGNDVASQDVGTDSRLA
jgi:hypothetical protein